MILLEELQALWKQIKIPLHGENFQGIELHSSQFLYGNPLLTIDDFGRRHLLIPVPETLKTQSDTLSGGIHITTEHWGVFNTNTLYVDVICQKAHLNDLFNLIVLEVIVECETNNGSHHPDKTAHHVLERWRDFILNEPTHLPSDSEMIGLFGELWFLRELTQINSRAVEIWKGPLGDRYDFYTGQSAIEVKASQQLSQRIATINGHKQLEQPPNGRLYFLHLQLDVTSVGKYSLQTLIEDIVSLGCNQRNLSIVLLKAGLTSDVLERVGGFRMNVVDVGLYAVDDSFPKITNDSFVDGNLPSNVIDLRYKINLSSIPKLSQPLYESFIQQFVGEISNAPLS